MCRVVLLRNMLGSRECCWSTWTGKDVMEMTSSQIKNLIKAGTKVCGLTIGKDGNLEPDLEGFYCTNIMEHRHCANYVPMKSEDCLANLFYIVIGKHEENGKVLYDCISTKFETLSLEEADLKAFIHIGVVSAGAKVENGKIVLADLEFKKEEPKTEEKKSEEIKVEETKQETVKVEESPLEEKIVSVDVEKVTPVKKSNKK